MTSQLEDPDSEKSEVLATLLHPRYKNHKVLQKYSICDDISVKPEDPHDPEYLGDFIKFHTISEEHMLLSKILPRIRYICHICDILQLCSAVL